ncbi:MAG: inositol monophosphatase family protein [Microthrixaceae bacterium]
MPQVPDLDAVVALLDEAAAASGAALSAYRNAISTQGGMRAKGDRPGQYRLDLAVDSAVLGVLSDPGIGVLSEESGLTRGDSEVVIVVDPVDGSTNASRGIPWYACSLCAVDSAGPWVALVVNLATGVRHSATRGQGAYRCELGGDPHRVETSGTTTVADSLVLLNGHPPAHFGWRQYRSLGATALDICAVADGSADATIDCTRDALGPWDYMAAMLILAEAGGAISDTWDRDLVVLEPGARRTPVSAASVDLLSAALDARGTG